MQVTKIRKNILGTISFTAKFTGMRKEQEFIVYPNPDPGCILIQSDTRIGRITGNTVTYAIGKMFVQLEIYNNKDTIENIEELRTAIRSTYGDNIGTLVHYDNSTAKLV